MSWDFSMEIDAGGPEPACILSDLNYTYNVSPMYYEAIGEDGIGGLHGKAGADCIPILRGAIAAMEDDPAKYQAMNPPNGWGSYGGALGVLRELLAWCVAAPKATMCVH